METLIIAPLPPPRRSFFFHLISVLLLTFSAYAAFHASRKPHSIVKSILGLEVAAFNASVDAGWPPFDGPHGPHRLGELDLAFLSSYSAGMYLAGHVGDRIDLSPPPRPQCRTPFAAPSSLGPTTRATPAPISLPLPPRRPYPPPHPAPPAAPLPRGPTSPMAI